MSEIWKDIKGYEGYSVSSEGRIRGSQGYVLSPSVGNHGFRHVTLCKQFSKERKTFLLHRLIAEAFIENPNGYSDVDHKNFNKLDNRVENLEWVNDNINNKRLFNSGRMKGNFVSVGMVLHLNTGRTYSNMLAISRELCLPYSSIYECVHGRQESVQGHQFRFVENNACNILKV